MASNIETSYTDSARIILKSSYTDTSREVIVSLPGTQPSKLITINDGSFATVNSLLRPQYHILSTPSAGTISYSPAPGPVIILPGTSTQVLLSIGGSPIMLASLLSQTYSQVLGTLSTGFISFISSGGVFISQPGTYPFPHKTIALTSFELKTPLAPSVYKIRTYLEPPYNYSIGVEYLVEVDAYTHLFCSSILNALAGQRTLNSNVRPMDGNSAISLLGTRIGASGYAHQVFGDASSYMQRMAQVRSEINNISSNAERYGQASKSVTSYIDNIVASVATPSKTLRHVTSSIALLDNDFIINIRGARQVGSNTGPIETNIRLGGAVLRVQSFVDYASINSISYLKGSRLTTNFIEHAKTEAFARHIRSIKRIPIVNVQIVPMDVSVEVKDNKVYVVIP